jgi:imidazole glycerol-phosphate synthase subunit HisH
MSSDGRTRFGPDMRVALVEYGIGNVGSVANALGRLGVVPAIASDGAALLALSPDCVIMPGVGAVGEALDLLRRRELEAALNRMVRDQGTPFLGICVGMQVMAEVCEEFGEHRGFGWIPGKVRRLVPEGSPLRLPHVGWNEIEVQAGDNFLGELDREQFYFVHSYAMNCPDEFVAATTDYGGPFTSAVQRSHTMGVQFHPEKSSKAGARLLRAFLERAGQIEERAVQHA